MTSAAALVAALYSPPGRPPGRRNRLLARAAKAHARLLAAARARGDPVLKDALAPLAEFLAGPAPEADRRSLANHPAVVEGLHALAPAASVLAAWHKAVTASPTPTPPAGPATAFALGTASLAAQLRTDPSWCGTQLLATDVLGRLSFPFSDWSLLFFDDAGTPLAGRIISVAATADRATWALDDSPVLAASRAEFDRMLVDNDAGLTVDRFTCPDPAVHVRLTRAPHLGRSPVRFDPVGIPHESGHAATTGGLVERVLAAVRRHAPGVAREFDAFVRTVRGFEFPRARRVSSFSDPTLPGVMGVSVAYTDRGDPCLDPLCFLWFGHEMGHTKNYLADTVLYARGEALVKNAADRSDLIPRYGRTLAVRTIIQVPYVHLYELELLTAFADGGFAGLPWRADHLAEAAGADLIAEIDEAFDLVDGYARLTPLGEEAVHYFHDLFVAAKVRWEETQTARV